MQPMQIKDVKVNLSDDDIRVFTDQMKIYAESARDAVRALAKAMEDFQRPVPEIKDRSGGRPSAKPHKRTEAARRHAKKKANRRRK
jgi:predicted phage tail protein